jgi:hypothetical protein
MYSRLSEIKNYKDIDILFLGSSHTYRGFDTRIFLDSGYKDPLMYNRVINWKECKEIKQ